MSNMWTTTSYDHIVRIKTSDNKDIAFKISDIFTIESVSKKGERESKKSKITLVRGDILKAFIVNGNVEHIFSVLFSDKK